MVSEKRRVLVIALANPFEPGGERRMELRAPGLRQTRVRDLTRERVLDRVLAFPARRGAGAAADKVTLDQKVEVRRPANELVDRPCPKDAADDRSRLQRSLLGRRQQIDASREDSLHGVRNLEALWEIGGGPASVFPLQHTVVNERRE